MRERLDPRYVAAERLGGWITLAVFTAGWAVALTIAWFSGSALWLGGMIAGGSAIAALLLWSATLWPALSHRHAWFVLDDHGIEIGMGVVFRRVTLVPRSRVQHTDVTQGPIERRFGLGTLVIHTAGTEHARVSLPGLARARAMELRDALLPRDGNDAV